MMANLTITVDDAVLRRARQRAVDERTSVAAEVREFLRRYARTDSGFEGFLALSRDLDATSRFDPMAEPASDALDQDDDGTDGSDGTDGTDGSDGADGADRTDGQGGRDEEDPYR